MNDGVIRAIEGEISRADPRALSAYLEGASRDGYRSSLHNTLRIAQKEREWLRLLQLALLRLGKNSWIYREGQRSVWVLETTWPGGQPGEAALESAAFARGYFDAEGGIPRNPSARFYVQFCQKDQEDLAAVRDRLGQLGVATGVIHNPSRNVDPDYWRFFVRARSWKDFIGLVGSWHPRKRQLLNGRLLAAGPSPVL